MQYKDMIVKSIYQARSNLGLLANQDETIPVPSDSIWAPKMYILGYPILGTNHKKID